MASAAVEGTFPIDVPYVPAEKGLVEACRRGDTQAFARLVATHEGMVLNLAARLLGDAEEARDVAQEVFIQVYRTLGRFEGRSTLKTWIYSIVVNHCRNRRRWWHRRRRDRSVSLDVLRPSEEVRLYARAEATSPFEHCRRRERSERVQAALALLSFEHRSVLLLREVEGLSCEEIGQALGVPAGTVKSRLSRAREALRQKLAPMFAAGGEP